MFFQEGALMAARFVPGRPSGACLMDDTEARERAYWRSRPGIWRLMSGHIGARERAYGGCATSFVPRNPVNVRELCRIRVYCYFYHRTLSAGTRRNEADAGPERGAYASAGGIVGRIGCFQIRSCDAYRRFRTLQTAVRPLFRAVILIVMWMIYIIKRKAFE